MKDRNFEMLAQDETLLGQAEVAAGLELQVAAPSFRWVASVKAMVQPVRAGSSAGLLGRFPESTHVAYLAQAEGLQTGDELVRVHGRTQLLEAAARGAQELKVADASGLVAGADLGLGEGLTQEVQRVAAVEGDTVQLAGALREVQGEGTQVAGLQRFEVLGVEDESGRGHHVRVVLRAKVV